MPPAPCPAPSKGQGAAAPSVARTSPCDFPPTSARGLLSALRTTGVGVPLGPSSASFQISPKRPHLTTAELAHLLANSGGKSEGGPRAPPCLPQAAEPLRSAPRLRNGYSPSLASVVPPPETPHRQGPGLGRPGRPQVRMQMPFGKCWGQAHTVTCLLGGSLGMVGLQPERPWGSVSPLSFLMRPPPSLPSLACRRRRDRPPSGVPGALLPLRSAGPSSRRGLREHLSHD